ncbi:MAG: hypothetical protein V1858_00540 [Candidatus Gottesmanbacteria bacterium]
MDSINFISAIPKIALFLLLIIGSAIVLEIFYFRKRRNINTPKEVIPTPPLSMNDELAQDLGTSPAPKLTTEVVNPVKKPLLPNRKVMAALVIFLIAVSIPVAVIVSRQRQEIRKQAYPGDVCHYDHDCTGWPNEHCTNGVCTALPTNCLPADGNCALGGDEDTICCSGVCSYGLCRGNDPTMGCGGFGESECWTHNNCHYINDSCEPRPPGPPPSPNGDVTCSANSSGVAIRNNSTQTVSGDVSWFASRCGENDSCTCGGQSSSENVSLAPGASWSKGMTGAGCAWQADVSGFVSCSGSGCEDCNGSSSPAPSPSGTPPTFAAQCLSIGIFNSNWTAVLTNQLTVNQAIYLTVRGSTNEPGGITKARFRFDSGAWQEVTTKHGTDYYIQYTVPTTGIFKVEAMVFNPTLGWH